MYWKISHTRVIKGLKTEDDSLIKIRKTLEPREENDLKEYKVMQKTRL